MTAAFSRDNLRSCVDVWRCKIDSCNGSHGLEGLLTDTERGRADKFISGRARTAFILARGLVRLLLAAYLEIEPPAVLLSRSPTGKPHVIDNTWIRFNISHSADLLLIAVTADVEVGIDVEETRPFANVDDVVSSCLHVEEIAELMSLSKGDQLRGFYSCWVRKEAVSKALGYGLLHPFNELVVGVGRTPADVMVGKSLETGSAVTLSDVTIDNGYVAAVAYCGAARRVCLCEVDIRQIATSGTDPRCRHG